MIDDYSDAEGGNAALMFSPNQINDMFTAFDAARFQIHVHAIGDLAVRAALDGMEAARHANAPWPSWHQIAHIQCIDPADVPRFAELGVVANIQPLWARLEPSVSEVALPMVGPERGKWMYAFRSLVDAGAMAALSSDWPVSTLNPFQIMETGTNLASSRRPKAISRSFCPNSVCRLTNASRATRSMRGARGLARGDDFVARTREMGRFHRHRRPRPLHRPA